MVSWLTTSNGGDVMGMPSHLLYTDLRTNKWVQQAL